MKHKNEKMPDGAAPRKTERRDGKKTRKPIIQAGRALVGDLRDFRAQMHRRLTAPFAFTPWQRGGLNE
jgi:hypothetical protein